LKSEQHRGVGPDRTGSLTPSRGETLISTLADNLNRQEGSDPFLQEILNAGCDRRTQHSAQEKDTCPDHDSCLTVSRFRQTWLEASQPSTWVVFECEWTAPRTALG